MAPTMNEYFVPSDGIDREVITVDVCRYLGNDALVRPGASLSQNKIRVIADAKSQKYEPPERGPIDGYYVSAYRELTTAMVDDLKADSTRWPYVHARGRRLNEYFIPSLGIERRIIEADIDRYLGNDAVVRSGVYTKPSGETVGGYFITAYRNLTTAMIEDLQADSYSWAVTDGLWVVLSDRLAGRTIPAPALRYIDKICDWANQNRHALVGEIIAKFEMLFWKLSTQEQLYDEQFWTNLPPWQHVMSQNDATQKGDGQDVNVENNMDQDIVASIETAQKGDGQDVNVDDNMHQDIVTSIETEEPENLDSSSGAQTSEYNECKLCGFRPQGNPKWFRGSMAKHMKHQHSTQPPKIYKCPYPGCTSEYKNRPDNLRQHQLEKGHFVVDDRADQSNQALFKNDYLAPQVYESGHTVMLYGDNQDPTTTMSGGFNPPNQSQNESAGGTDIYNLPPPPLAPPLSVEPAMSRDPPPTRAATEFEQATDSGYASIWRDAHSTTKERLEQAHPSLTASDAIHEGNEQDTNIDDAATAYSVAWSVPEAELDTYKAELSDALLNNVRRHVSRPDQLESIVDALPNFLRSFALRLGGPGSSKAEKEVMFFVHKHRSEIAGRFNSSANDAQEGDVEARPATSSEEPILSWDIGHWLRNTKLDPMAATAETEGQQSYDIWRQMPQWDDTIEHLDAADEIEEQPSLPDKRGYREVVFSSVAYQWMMASVLKMVMLAPVTDGDDFCATLRSKVSACLEKNRSVSSRRDSERYTMIFLAEWNPTEFLHEQFPGREADIGRLLGEVLTLTGSATDAQALPCAEYLNQTWPSTGKNLLEALKTALVSGKDASGKLGDGTTINVLFRKSRVDVQVDGTADSIAEVGEQIAWIGAALRPSPVEMGLATCRPKVRTITAREAPSVCVISFDLEANSTAHQEQQPGQCWHEMFLNPVLVEGYPIPRRSRQSSGLEVPLEVMSALTSCPRINQFMGFHLLKGFSTALRVMKKVGDEILWHFYYTADGSRLPYPTPGDQLDDCQLDLKGLTRARHIVGWCSEAKFYAGAPGMNYNIKTSKLKRPGREFSLEKVSFSVGELVTGGCQFAIGRKDPHVRITRGSYKSKLKWIDQKYVTLWDIDDQRGWLVNGTAALMHLLRSSLFFSGTDKFRSEFLFEEAKLEESPNPLTLSASLDILLNPLNQKMKLYLKDEQTYTETKVLSNGQRETVTKTVSSHITLKDRVEELYETLEKLIDHNATSEASYKGVDAKPRLQDQLEGWDFADIATDMDPFILKKATLPLHLLSWVDFVRAVPAITLFGQGFGDIIRASPLTTEPPKRGCVEWETVPKNRHLLCVSVADLRDIIDLIGDQWTTPITLGPGILWHNPHGDDPFLTACTCTEVTKPSPKHSHHTVQDLASSKLQFRQAKPTVDLTAHQNGAVIFGRKQAWSMSLGTPRSPEDASRSGTSTTLGHSMTSGVTSASDFASSASLSTDDTTTIMSGQLDDEGHSQGPSAPGPLMQFAGQAPAQSNPGDRKGKRRAEDDDLESGNELQGNNERPSRMRKLANRVEQRFRGRDAREG